MARMSGRRSIVAGAACLLLAVGAGCQPPSLWRSTLESPSVTGDGGGDSVMTAELSVSANGAIVAFASQATNLVPEDTAGRWNVFVRDLSTGTTTLVSRSVTGSGAANRDSTTPVVSPDGTKVAFVSRASDLVPLSAVLGVFTPGRHS